MKKVTVFFAGAAVLATTAQALAESITKPHTFVQGTPANATEVNANFDTIYDQVNKVGSLLTVDNVYKRVGIGTANPASILEVASDFNVSGLAALTVTSFYNDASNHPSHLYGRRARGSMGAPSPILAGDSIFMLGPKGYNAVTGFNHTYNAAIGFHATEDFTGTGMGTDITFSNTPDGATHSVERMRIDQNGRVGIGTTTPESILDIASDFAETGSTARLNLTTYYNGSNHPAVVTGRKARGSKSAPAALQPGDVMLSISSRGYGDTGFGEGASGDTASLAFIATENFSDFAKGTAIRFRNTPNGSTLARERMRIDQNGNVGIGTATPSTTLEVASDYNISGLADLSIVSYHDNNSGHPAHLTGRRARGSMGAPTATLNGDYIFLVGARGYNETTGFNHSTNASIGFHATEDYTDTTMGTDIRFRTTPNGTANTVERMRIDQNGHVGIGTSTPQATLDVNGFMKLAVNASEPVACDANTAGAVALTSNYTMCACNGTYWVYTTDGLMLCTW